MPTVGGNLYKKNVFQTFKAVVLIDIKYVVPWKWIFNK